MFMVNNHSCNSHIVQQVLSSAQFARKKRTPRSKSPNYIARDKIKLYHPVYKPVSVSTFRAWSPASYDNVCLSIKNEGGKNMAT